MRHLPSILLGLLFVSTATFAQNHAVPLVNVPLSPSIATPGGSGFEANNGQFDRGIDFVARVRGYTVYLEAGRARVRLNRSASFNLTREPGRDEDEVLLSLVGAAQQPELNPETRLTGYINYLFGSDPQKWVTDVPHYAGVRYTNVYPGIDMIYHKDEDGLENDFVIQPGVDAGQIALSFSGVHKLRVNRWGELALDNVGLRLRRPHAYQVIGGKKFEVQATYALHNGYASFHLGRYDASRTLIIDPVLVYATYLSGPLGIHDGSQSATAAAVDATGNLLVAGATDSPSFPVTPGVLGPTPGAAFISKLDPTGTSLIYSTYVSGVAISSLAVDSSGNVYVAGNSGAGLPIPAGSTPFQSALKSIAVLKLNSTGTAALAATYLGGSGHDFFGGMSVDSAGAVYVTGTTLSTDFPTQNALQGSLGSSGQNAFVSKLDPTLSSLVYSTYLGQNTTSSGAAIALDPSLNAYIVGNASPGFPTTTDAFQTTASLGGAFFLEINPAGSSVLYSTYLTGTGGAPGLKGTSGFPGSQASSVIVDSSENVFLTGLSYSLDFPFMNPIQPCTGDITTFLSEFNSTGVLVFSTCLGQTSPQNPQISNNLTSDSLGNIYVSGMSDTSLPLKNPIKSSPAGLFIIELDPNTRQLLFSSFVAGPTVDCCDSSGDHIAAIVVDPNENIYAVGLSVSPHMTATDSFPIYNAFQPLFGTPPPCTNASGCPYYGIAFLMKISPGSGAAAAVSPSQLQFAATQTSVSSTPETAIVYDMGTEPLAVSNISTTGDFTQTNNCVSSVPAASSCSVQVTFAPTALGARTGNVTITDNSPGSPHTIVLSGIGGQPSATLSPSSLSFPSQLVSTPSFEQTISLTNEGTVGLKVANIQIRGPFSQSGNCDSSTLDPGGGCVMAIIFTPTGAGPFTGTLTITDNAPDSPQTVALSGTGENPSLGLSIASGGSSSAKVTAGSSATYSLSIGGGGMSGTAKLSCTGAPAAATCTVPSTTSVSATAASTFNAMVTTTARTQATLHPGAFWDATWAWGFALIGCVFLAKHQPQRSRIGYLGLLALFALAISSCGGGSSNRQSGGTTVGTLAGTYNLVVTATSGGTTQTQNLTLIVQ